MVSLTLPTAPAWLRRRPRRRAAPTILQMEAVECGAASLAMVLAHHGLWVPLEELREACGVSRDGTKAANVLRAARRYGMVAKGFRKEPGKLHELAWPCILFWNFNHFLVLEGITATEAFVNDPLSGRRRIPRAEFDALFTGVALAFERGPEFRPGGRPPGILGPLRARLAGVGGGLWFVLAAALALVVPGIVAPALSRAFVDEVLVAQQQGWLNPLLIGLCLTALIRGLATLLQEKALVRLEARLAVVPASAFLWHVLRLPMRFYGQRHASEVASRVAANDRLARLLSTELAGAALAGATVLFFGLAMLAYDPLLALGVLGFGAANWIAVRWGAEQQKQAARQVLAERGRLGAATVGAIRAIETIKGSALESVTFARWTGLQARLLHAAREAASRGVVAQALPGLLRALASAFVLGAGAVMVMRGRMSLGELVAMQTLAESFMAPITRLVALGPVIRGARADIERVEDAARYPADPPPAAPEGEQAALAGAVELRGLSFGYSPLDPPLIDDFALVLKPGARVALVGASGSGKSTVGRMVAGLLVPRAGEVLFDGRPAAAIPPALRAQGVAYVDQEVFLFEGTVRDNLTLWDPTVPEAALTRALADASILDEVASRPGGLDAHVAEGGMNFSGGQRQRLEIARALAGEPTVLILDEATAALDPTTEKEVDDNLRRRGVTCIIVAHRLSTIRDADEIVVLRQGRVVERGTHDDLLAQGGEYAALVREG